MALKRISLTVRGPSVGQRVDLNALKDLATNRILVLFQLVQACEILESRRRSHGGPFNIHVRSSRIVITCKRVPDSLGRKTNAKQTLAELVTSCRKVFTFDTTSPPSLNTIRWAHLHPKQPKQLLAPQDGNIPSVSLHLPPPMHPQHPLPQPVNQQLQVLRYILSHKPALRRMNVRLNLYMTTVLPRFR